MRIVWKIEKEPLLMQNSWKIIPNILNNDQVLYLCGCSHKEIGKLSMYEEIHACSQCKNEEFLSYRNLCDKEKLLYIDEFKYEFRFTKDPNGWQVKEMERVFDNLISNALKYTKEHETITISIQEMSEQWMFSISNPIEKEIDTTKIFHKYYRHDEEIFGLGLGLDLVESICKQNNIKIGAQVREKLFYIEMEIEKVQ